MASRSSTVGVRRCPLDVTGPFQRRHLLAPPTGPQQQPVQSLVPPSVYENFAKGDIPAVLADLAPELDWVESPQEWLPHRGVHHSPDEVVSNVFAMVMERFDEFALIPHRFHEAGDVVVVEGRAAGKTKVGGVLDARAAWSGRCGVGW